MREGEIEIEQPPVETAEPQPAAEQPVVEDSPVADPTTELGSTATTPAAGGGGESIVPDDLFSPTEPGSTPEATPADQPVEAKPLFLADNAAVVDQIMTRGGSLSKLGVQGLFEIEPEELALLDMIDQVLGSVPMENESADAELVAELTAHADVLKKLLENSNQPLSALTGKLAPAQAEALTNAVIDDLIPDDEIDDQAEAADAPDPTPEGRQQRRLLKLLGKMNQVWPDKLGAQMADLAELAADDLQKMVTEMWQTSDISELLAFLFSPQGYQGLSGRLGSQLRESREGKEEYDQDDFIDKINSADSYKQNFLGSLKDMYTDGKDLGGGLKGIKNDQVTNLIQELGTADNPGLLKTLMSYVYQDLTDINKQAENWQRFETAFITRAFGADKVGKNLLSLQLVDKQNDSFFYGIVKTNNEGLFKRAFGFMDGQTAATNTPPNTPPNTAAEASSPEAAQASTEATA